jgi:hypothetical protein
MQNDEHYVQVLASAVVTESNRERERENERERERERE